MGAKTKNVGGGGATNVALDWNALLGGIVNNGQAGNANAPGPKIPNAAKIFGNVPQGAGNTSASAQQQTGLFSQAINNALQGNIGEVAGVNDYASYLAQVQNAVNQGPAQPGTVGSNNAAGVDANSSVNVGAVNAPGAIDIGAIVAALTQAAGVANPGYQQTQFDPNDPRAAAITQMAAQANNAAVADMRERFGMQGNTGGTGAQYAEAVQRAQLQPQIMAALGQLYAQNEGLAQNAYGLNAQNAQANAGNTLQALATAGGLSAETQAQNAQNQLQTAGLNQNALLAQMQDVLSRAGINAQLQAGNADRAQNADAQNANNVLQSQQLQQNILGMLLQGAGQQAGFGLQQQQMQQAAQQNMLAQIFAAMQQSNALGTPQAQTIQKPGAFSQIMGGLTGLAGLAAPFVGPQGLSLGGLFGGGSQALPAVVGQGVIPQLQLPNPYRG